MGLFDAFTGAPARNAAAQNTALYNANKTEGMGYLDTGYGRGVGALNSAVGAYTPLANLGGSLVNGVNLYQDALGVNGSQGVQRAQDAFQSGPGYQFQLGQGLQALDRGAASRGMLGSGNALMAEQKYGNDLANQSWNNWLGNLGGMVNPALSAVGGAAAGQAGGYTNLAALAQNDAQNRVNLGTTTTSGIANNNLQSAQAQMQANNNLWNFGLRAFSPGQNGSPSPAQSIFNMFPTGRG